MVITQIYRQASRLFGWSGIDARRSGMNKKVFFYKIIKLKLNSTKYNVGTIKNKEILGEQIARRKYL